jgi:hypothetical protein
LDRRVDRVEYDRSVGTIGRGLHAVPRCRDEVGCNQSAFVIAVVNRTRE